MATDYYVGSVCRFSVNIQTSGADADPTALALKVQDPSGNTATYTYALAEVTKDSVGDYYKDITLDESGSWYYQWTGTGSNAGAVEGAIVCRETAF